MVKSTIHLLYCSYFTKRPHIAGGEQNRKLAEYIRDKWKSYKFDRVEMVQYNVLLSMPPRDKPNVVKIVNTTDGDVVWNVEGPEKVTITCRFLSLFKENTQTAKLNSLSLVGSSILEASVDGDLSTHNPPFKSGQFSKLSHFSNIWCFFERIFPHNKSNLLVDSFFACFWHF